MDLSDDSTFSTFRILQCESDNCPVCNTARHLMVLLQFLKVSKTVSKEEIDEADRNTIRDMWKEMLLAMARWKHEHGAQP